MTDKKIFLVKAEEITNRFYQVDRQKKDVVELTPEKLEQQFLSKELVLRKLDGLKILQNNSVKSGMFNWRLKAKIDILTEILNECSSTPENSDLLKKLESLDTEKEEGKMAVTLRHDASVSKDQHNPKKLGSIPIPSEISKN